MPSAEAARSLASVLEGPFDVQKVLTAEEIRDLVDRSHGVQERLRRRGAKPVSLFDLVVLTLAARYREGILTFDEGMLAAIRGKMFPGARVA